MGDFIKSLFKSEHFPCLSLRPLPSSFSSPPVPLWPLWLLQPSTGSLSPKTLYPRIRTPSFQKPSSRRHVRALRHGSPILTTLKERQSARQTAAKTWLGNVTQQASRTASLSWNRKG